MMEVSRRDEGFLADDFSQKFLSTSPAISFPGMCVCGVCVCNNSDDPLPKTVCVSGDPLPICKLLKGVAMATLAAYLVEDILYTTVLLKVYSE